MTRVLARARLPRATSQRSAYLAGFTESAVAIPAQQRHLWDHITE